MDRREVLKLGLGSAIASAGATEGARSAVPIVVPIIDTHIHLFDSTRTAASLGHRQMTQLSISRRFPATINRSHGRLESLERSQSKRVRSKTITIGCCSRLPIILLSSGWWGI
jgi:hypothetical protein